MSGETGKPIRRGMKVLLVVSLALNLAVVGLVAGFFLRGGPSGGGAPRSIDIAIGPLGSALPRDDRRAIGDALRQNQSSRGLSREQRRAFQGALADAVVAEPFDRAGLLATIAGRQDQLLSVQNTAAELLLDRIEAMTSDERAAYAEAIRRFDMRR